MGEIANMFPPLPWGVEVAAAPTVFIKISCPFVSVKPCPFFCLALKLCLRFEATSVYLCGCKTVSKGRIIIPWNGFWDLKNHILGTKFSAERLRGDWECLPGNAGKLSGSPKAEIVIIAESSSKI